MYERLCRELDSNVFATLSIFSALQQMCYANTLVRSIEKRVLYNKLKRSPQFTRNIATIAKKLANIKHLAQGEVGQKALPMLGVAKLMRASGYYRETINDFKSLNQYCAFDHVPDQLEDYVHLVKKVFIRQKDILQDTINLCPQDIIKEAAQYCAANR